MEIDIVVLSKDWRGFISAMLDDLIIGKIDKSYVIEEIITLLSQAEEKGQGLNKRRDEIPMGVSQWREHGKKYGYWEYFDKKRDGGITA